MQPADAAVERLTALVARQRDELERLRAQAASRSLIDLARGVLMEQLGCSPDDAQRQLERLSNEAEVAVSELASQITSQPLPADEHDAGWHNLSLARGAVESASDLNAVATAMLEEALADLGATAVAMWRAEPHGGMHLIGQAGLRQSEASRWRHIHPDMRTLQQEVAHTAAEPITDAGRAVGAMIVCWPDRLETFTEPQRKQLLALADIASHAILAGAAQEWPFDQQTGSAIGLLESLLDGLLILRPIVDTDGTLSDF